MRVSVRVSTRSLRSAILACALLLRAGAPTAWAADDDTLNVFAAASLTASFKTIGAAFEATRPGTKVAFNFAGSPTLVQQIKEGAPADVFASADEANMQKVVEAGAAAGAPQIFAQNLLQIAVAQGNPKHIAGLADLAKPGLIVVLCAETVPCGRYAVDAFTKAGVTPPAGSREPDVKAVLTKVALGEADAGLVYVTDVRAAADKVEGVGLASDHNVSARYPIATLREAAHTEAARAFVAFVLSDPGNKILGEYGFRAP
jgi:molybdate transport system substrate-binding protein